MYWKYRIGVPFALRFEAFPSKVGDGEVCLARVHGLHKWTFQVTVAGVPGSTVVADDLLQRLDFTSGSPNPLVMSARSTADA